jgi:hypothetical protein
MRPSKQCAVFVNINYIVMKKIIVHIILFLFLVSAKQSYSQAKYPENAPGSDSVDVSVRLSNQYMPEFGVWEWGRKELTSDGFKHTIDQASEHSPYNFLIPFLRFPDHEVVDTLVHNQLKLAAGYGVKKHILLVPDLDVRVARRAFQQKYPDELQQMLRLREVSLPSGNPVDVVIPAMDLNDHYSGGSITHHIPLRGELLRVYTYQRAGEQVIPETIRDITAECSVLNASKDSVAIQIKASRAANTYACVMAAFTHLYPDIFGPHLMAFQRQIIEQYGDIPLAGVCKDEWGFPPYYPRFYKQGMHDFWYSPHRAKAYADETGRDLAADCLLMSFAMKGRDAEQQMVVNRYVAMSRERNTALENDFYETVKKVFGPDAAVTVHSTWWPYPDKSEFKKNGLDWWAAKRDWGQTDEVVPFGVRTALAKKWGSPVWYNMYYKEDLADQVWSSVLAGGRIDYLPFQSLYAPEGLMRGESRIRLLNYISESPLDCRVAVIFGYPAATNRTSPDYEDVGMGLVDSLWHEGYPADLIPTYEIKNGSLRVDSLGTIWYGSQAYEAVILYHPDLEERSVSDFFKQAGNGKTALFRLGKWTRDFEGNVIDRTGLFPETMVEAAGVADAFNAICAVLEQKQVLKQSPATGVLDNRYFKLRDFNHSSCVPPTTGFCRLIDGTVIYAAGTDQASGDTIRVNFRAGNYPVSVDAVGIAATRLDEKGNLQALAAGGLKSFKTTHFEMELKQRVDLALWIDKNDEWQGVIQGWNGAVPPELEAITKNWIRLDVPEPPLMESFR